MRVPRRVDRIATISVHTSPLDQPGTGDAGGMNVYIVEVAKLLAARGVEVDIFTRATCRALPPVVEAAPGVRVRHVVAGPFEELSKEELAGRLDEFTAGTLRAMNGTGDGGGTGGLDRHGGREHDAPGGAAGIGLGRRAGSVTAAVPPARSPGMPADLPPDMTAGMAGSTPAGVPAGTVRDVAAAMARATGRGGPYDLLHTHYWLSGRVGAPIRRWLGLPLVHSMHTLAKVKNAALADGDAAEPTARILGEEQVVASADRLVANTAGEAEQLVELYGADPARVGVVAPGVDLSLFHPGGPGAVGQARRRLGLARDAVVLLFVGRLQPLKAPDVLLRAAAGMLAEDPALRSRLVVAVVGGPSGSAMDRPDDLPELARRLGIADVVRFEPPCPQHELADWYRAATVTVVPSYNESFGLVAVESQACGTPVVAAAVGGLRTAVRDGETGLLISGHDPRDYAAVLRRLARATALRDRLARGTAGHARAFGWAATVDRLMEVYTGAVTEPVTVIV